jgi:menaquinol-cytochrome c reductase iron-sulfur subunit
MGVTIAISMRWGSRWYLYTAAPWFWSVVKLAPDARAVSVLPALAQAHFINGFILILLFPFTRLVHLVTVPITYLWRPYQVVIWNHRPEQRSGPAPRGSSGEAPRLSSGQASDPPGDPPASGGPPQLESAPSPGGLAGQARDGEGSRRHFLSRLSILLGIVAAGAAIPSFAFLLGLRKAPQVWRPVGSLDEFPVGTTTLVSFVDPSPLPWAGVSAKTAAWLRRNGEESFVAFAVNCTHLGCPVRWLPEADLFMCPCHGGVFYNDGRTAAGPPPRPLTRYEVRVNNGHVEVLTSPIPIA